MSGRGGKREGAGRPSGSKDKRTNVQNLSIDDLKAIVSKLEELGEGLDSLTTQQVDQLIYARLLLQASQGDFKSQQLVLDRYVKRAGTKDKHEIQPISITKNAAPYIQLNELLNEIAEGNVDVEAATLLERLIVKRADLVSHEIKSELSKHMNIDGKVVNEDNTKRRGMDGMSEELEDNIRGVLLGVSPEKLSQERQLKMNRAIADSINKHNERLLAFLEAESTKKKGLTEETVRMLKQEILGIKL
jgi:hypothetical protein